MKNQAFVAEVKSLLLGALDTFDVVGEVQQEIVGDTITFLIPMFDDYSEFVEYCRAMELIPSHYEISGSIFKISFTENLA